jgi:hypothetical protein
MHRNSDPRASRRMHEVVMTASDSSNFEARTQEGSQHPFVGCARQPTHTETSTTASSGSPSGIGRPSAAKPST